MVKSRLEKRPRSRLEDLLPFQVPLERALLGRVRQADEVAEPVLQFAQRGPEVDLAIGDGTGAELLIPNASKSIELARVAKNLEAGLERPLPGPERLPSVVEIEVLGVVIGTEAVLQEQIQHVDRVPPFLLERRAELEMIGIADARRFADLGEDAGVEPVFALVGEPKGVFPVDLVEAARRVAGR